jgi:hypothetical protein
MTIFLKEKENIIMANYEIDPKILPFLPKGVELDCIMVKHTYMSLVYV